MMTSALFHTRSIETHQLDYSLPEFSPETQASIQPGRDTVSSHADMQERELVQALRNGDEAAFSTLIDRYHSKLQRLARSFVPSEAIAEEVVQETWLAVLEGINRFEGRSSLQTWIFRILTNRAKTRGQRENRYVTFADTTAQTDEDTTSSLEPERFHTSGHLAGHWVIPPTTWDDNTPERLLGSKENLIIINNAISRLPARQRQIIILHDLEGVDSEEICHMLKITPTNQRVLLHRARSRVRANY